MFCLSFYKQCKRSRKGPQRIPGTMNISNFYTLMIHHPIIDIGQSIEFNQNGPSNNNNITRLSSSKFNLELIGIYGIIFQVNIIDAGQLVIVINDIELDYTVVGKAIGTNQIIGDCLILITEPNSILSINNPSSSKKELAITQYSGDNKAISANLIIKRYE